MKIAHMKVAQVNKYLHAKGGADVACLRTAHLLRQAGHEVVLMGMGPAGELAEGFPTYLVSEVSYEGDMSLRERLAAAGRILYSREAKAVMRRLIAAEQPDIIHLHNIYHQLSPSVIDAAAECGVPMVMTVHDYKLTCAVYTHLRSGRVCEKCGGGRFYNALRYRCTKGSIAGSAVNTAEMYLHRSLLDTYAKVGTCIAPSRFLLRKVRELGCPYPFVNLPYVLDPSGFEPRYDRDGPEVVYFGRLSYEKGLHTLLDAVKGLDLRLRVIGRGPEGAALRAKAREEGIDNVRFLGYRSGPELRSLVGECMFALVPSEWYENYPLSIMESFALGKPVVGARIGGIPELVGEEERGLLFEPGDHLDMREKLLSLADEPALVEAMGRRARRFAEETFAPQAHYPRLMEIYRRCLAGEPQGDTPAPVPQREAGS